MRYPPEMTLEDIMNFEYELGRVIDMERGVGFYWEINADCQVVAEKQQQEMVDSH